MVNEWKLKAIQQVYYNKPRELTRRLMKLILGEEVLRRSSPTGKNGREKIPEHIFLSVESK